MLVAASHTGFRFNFRRTAEEVRLGLRFLWSYHRRVLQLLNCNCISIEKSSLPVQRIKAEKFDYFNQSGGKSKHIDENGKEVCPLIYIFISINTQK